MATLTNTKLIKISTPFRKEGILWDDFRERESLNYLVWQASSKEMNPTIPDDFLREEESRNREDFRREYLAEFTDSIIGWITWEILEPCIMRGCREFPRVSNGTYVAAVDPAFSHSDFGFAILHRSDNEHINVAFAARWTGTKSAPLNLESVSIQINDVLQRFGINSLVGDQHCFAILRQHFEKAGLFYREFRFGDHSRASIFGNLRQLIAQQRISFVDEPELLRQLRSLDEIRNPNGNIDIRPPSSSRDDMAIAVAVAAFELSRVPQCSIGPILGGPKYCPTFWRSPMWYDENVMMICDKYPGCFEQNSCECIP